MTPNCTADSCRCTNRYTGRMLEIISDEMSVKQLTRPSSQTVRAMTGRAEVRDRRSRRPRRPATSIGYTEEVRSLKCKVQSTCHVTLPLALRTRHLTSRCLLHRRRNAALTAEERRKHEPAERQRQQRIAEDLPIAAVRTIRLGGPVQRFAIREEVRLGQLVESVDKELHDEDRQENCSHLEEQRQVDAMAVARPQPRDERG